MAYQRKNKEIDGTSVFEMPLVVEQWQADILDARLEMLRKIYNTVQHKLLKSYRYYIENNPDYSRITREIKARRKNKLDAKGLYKQRDKIIKTTAMLVSPLQKPITFSGMGIQHLCECFGKQHVDKDRIYRDFGLQSIPLEMMSSAVWKSWEKFLYGNGNKIRFKRYEELNSIGFRKHNGSFGGIVFNPADNTLTLLYKRSKGKKSKNKHLTLRLAKPRTEYDERSLKMCGKYLRGMRIVRRFIRGRKKYYVQFTLDGFPFSKGRKLGNGTVGLDVGTSTVAVSSEKRVSIDVLAGNVIKDERRLKKIQRKMDRSRRANNPDNFNEDATIKKGKRLEWKDSNNYRKLRAEVRDIQRKNAEKRKLAHMALANELLSCGNVFRVEHNNYAAMAKKTKTAQQDEQGKFKSRKRYGKTIGNRAPSMFVTILKNKVEALGGEFHNIDEFAMAATKFDFTSGERTDMTLSQRNKVLSNGNVHQRDMMSAFNIQHAISMPKSANKPETFVGYDIDTMHGDYPNYCALEKMELEKIRNGTKPYLKSVVKI